MKLSDIILAALMEQRKNNPNYEYKRGLCSEITDMCKGGELPVKAITQFERAVYAKLADTACVYVRSFMMEHFHTDLYVVADSNWDYYQEKTEELGTPLWWNFYIWWIWDLKRKGL